MSEPFDDTETEAPESPPWLPSPVQVHRYKEPEAVADASGDESTVEPPSQAPSQPDKQKDAEAT